MKTLYINLLNNTEQQGLMPLLTELKCLSNAMDKAPDIEAFIIDPDTGTTLIDHFYNLAKTWANLVGWPEEIDLEGTDIFEGFLETVIV